MQVSRPVNSQTASDLIPVSTNSTVTSSVERVQILQLQQQSERERLISRITWRIHQSLELQDILNTTVEDVRHFLQTDRVVILRFGSNWNGSIVVESVGEEWTPILGMTFKDPCFEKTYVACAKQGRIRAIEDLAVSGLTQCHIDLLTQFQVKANLILPIVQGEKLWGLLIAHHCRSPRKWQSLEIELLKELAAQAAIAIQQSELYNQVQLLNSNLEQQVKERTEQLEQSLDFAAVLKRITDRIRDSLDERQILQTAVRELVSVLKVDYCCAALYNPTRTTATVQHEFTHADLGSAIGQALTVADTPKVHDLLLNGEHFAAYSDNKISYFQAGDSGDLACPTLFERFAAKLLCPIYLDPATCDAEGSSSQNICGVESGAFGYLAVIDQTYHVFSDSEIKLVTQVANQCAIAIRQARLYEASRSQVKALERLNQLKDDFLSTVSHELRTPVASMKMAIQMLDVSLQKEGIVPPQKTSHYLKILYDQCEREIELINDLLNLQQLEAGEYLLTSTEIELQPWLTQLIQSLKEKTQFQQRNLEISLPPNFSTLVCDQASLHHILRELLDNACKHSPIDSTIKLQGRVDDAVFYLSICNSGADIPAEELTHVFDKFYRVPSENPWKQSGTGLGLALVKKLITHMNGSIQVSSKAGLTCFTIGLPLQKELGIK